MFDISTLYTLELLNHLVWFLGLGGCDDPDQRLLPVVAVGAVHEELVPGAADALPLRVAPPGAGGLARGGGVAGGGVPVGHHLAAAGLDLLHQRVRAHARADVPETVSGNFCGHCISKLGKLAWMLQCMHVSYGKLLLG